MRRGPFAYLSEPVALPDSFRGGRPRAVMQNYVHDNHHFLPFVNGCVHIVHTGRKRLLLLWNIFVNSAKRIYLSEIKRVRRITPFSGNELATVLIAVVCIALLV